MDTYYEGFFDANPPTYPGYLPWRLTGLIPITETGRGVGDYRIDPEHLPSSNLAVRLDLFGEVQFDQWFGPIIPLPSFQLTGAFTTTIIEIHVSYWNWLTTGYAGRIIYPEGVDQQFPRPMTFNYSVSEKYKETVHYGVDMILLAIIRTLGIVEVVSISAFLPFLEYRTQSRLLKTRVEQAKITAMSRILDDGGFKYLLTTDAGLADGVDRDLAEESLSASIYLRPAGYTTRKTADFRQYDIQTVPVLGLREGSVFVVDATQFITAEGGPPPVSQENWLGSYFLLKKSIQVEDPTLLFSERKPYIELVDAGYQTQDQDISKTGDFLGVLVNPEEYIAAANIEIEKLKKITPENEKQTAEIQAAVARLESTVKILGSSEPVVDDLVLFAVTPSEGSALGEDLESILALSQTLARESLVVQLEIKGGTLSSQNFHSGSQDDQYVVKYGFFLTGETGRHSFQIRQHMENGIFLVDNRSSTSWAALNDFLLQTGDVSDYTISTEMLWMVNDISTGPKSGYSGNNDLHAAMFWSTISWVSVTDANGDLLQNGSDFSDDSLILFDMKLSDDSYYDLQQLSDRWLTEPPLDNTKSVKGWTKYKNWKLWNFGRTTSFEIVDILEVDTSTSSFRLLARPGNFELEFDEAGNPVFESTDKWWIAFNDLFSTLPPYNYIAAPQFKFEALLSQITPAKITFSGYYVGSPMQSISMQEGQNIALVEDSNAFYSFLTARPLYSSTIIAFKTISYYYDDSTDSGYILYTRDDDQSNSLYLRQGRVDFFHDIVEFLVFTGEPEIVDIISSKSGDGAETQTMILSNLGKRDIVGFLMNRADTSLPPFPESSQFDDTIWSMRLGDKTLSFPSTSNLENTIYTRKAYDLDLLPNAVVKKDIFVGAPASSIRFYQTSEPFGRNEYVQYQFAASTRTGDTEAGDGSTFSFVPVLTPLKKSEFTAASKFLVVPHERIIAGVANQALFPYMGGERMILYVSGQGSSENPITATTPVLNIGRSPAVVPGATDGYASADNPFGIDVQQNGVFMLVSTDDFSTYLGGGIYRPDPAPATATSASEGSAYQFPFLLAPNTTQSGYVKNNDRIGIAGYSKIQSGGEEVTVLSYYEVNTLKVATDTVYSINTSSGTSFLHGNFYEKRQIALTTAKIEGVTGDAFVLTGLTPEPLAVATDGKNRLVIFQNGDLLDYVISSSEGESWSYMDDIFLVRSALRVSSPRAKIINDRLHLFYIEDKEKLMYKEMDWPKFLSFHGRLLKKTSSKESDEELDAAKQEFQALLDNIQAKQVATTFEQQVDFTVNNRLLITVVYFDAAGLVNASRSTDSGDTWDDSPPNF